MRLLICFLILILFGGPLVSFSQEAQKANIRSEGLKSVSELETDLRERKAKPVEKSFIRYDRDGSILEIIERDDTGLVTLHESYEYDQSGNKTTEIQYEPNGQIKKKHVYKFTNNLRTERLTYDKAGKLIGQKKYVYEFHDK